ncbi:hypothetical protein FKW31_10060 [Acetobacter sp. DmW_136]|uniref:hypothetical protein n=1 Tax=Acetobacter sp. DmW_136 TaxID=2591091 RepID=UPI0012384616|nr:hypothetical protein [Acetobacter sp. DmW_136]KAA8385146.1 hypothetical protein FKW31_10060 [Acetobacter sp. DmW_136]
MICPNIAEFDRSQIPSPKTLRSAPCEMRGVLDKLLDALKEMRSCVFRAGTLVLNDADIAKQAGLQADELERNLPQMIARGMLARDDENALFSTVMYDRLLRREERAARTAIADAGWQQRQENGDVPEGISRKAMSARENGKKGGRKRKGESDEEYYARKEREQAAHRAQQNMMMPIPGGNAAAQKPTQETQQVSVSDNLGSVGSTVEKSNNIYKPNSSSTGETQTPEPSIPDADIKRVAGSIIRVARMEGKKQGPHALRYAKEWLKAGLSEDQIIQNLQQTIREYGEKEISHLGAFDRNMKALIADIQIKAASGDVETPVSADPQVDFATHQHGEAQRYWSVLMRMHGKMEIADEAFIANAAQKGFPPISPREAKTAYLEYYRKNPPNMEAKAA